MKRVVWRVAFPCKRVGDGEIPNVLREMRLMMGEKLESIVEEVENGLVSMVSLVVDTVDDEVGCLVGQGNRSSIESVTGRCEERSKR